MRSRAKSGARLSHGGGFRPEPGHRDENTGRRRGRMLGYGELRLLILALIAERPSHGYELIKSVEERFGGSYTPSPGVLYPTLSWFDDVGYAISEVGDGNRKSYRITAEGEAYLRANRAAVDALLARCQGGRRGAPAAVAKAMDDLKAALRGQLRRHDVREADVARIVAVLQDAARRIDDGRQPISEKP